MYCFQKPSFPQKKISTARRIEIRFFLIAWAANCLGANQDCHVIWIHYSDEHFRNSISHPIREQKNRAKSDHIHVYTLSTPRPRFQIAPLLMTLISGQTLSLFLSFLFLFPSCTKWPRIITNNNMTVAVAAATGFVKLEIFCSPVKFLSNLGLILNS